MVTHDRLHRGRTAGFQRRDLTRRQDTLTPGRGDSWEFVEEPATMHQSSRLATGHPAMVTKPRGHRHRPITSPVTTGLQPSRGQCETGRFTLVRGPGIDELNRREHDLVECGATGSHTLNRTGVRSPDQHQTHIPYGHYRYAPPTASPIAIASGSMAIERLVSARQGGDRRLIGVRAPRAASSPVAIAVDEVDARS